MNLFRPSGKGLLILVISGWLASCNNDLEILATDYTVYPVVYSVLEVHRDTLAVRLTKTFRGSGSALDYARIPDSIYFPEARVWLESWNGNFRVAKRELVKTRMEPKKPGSFIEDPNWQYIAVRSPETEILFRDALSELEYHLTIDIPGLPLVFANTKVYQGAILLSPRISTEVHLISDALEFSWENTSPYSELYFRLLYSDIYADTAIDRSLNWRDYHSVSAEYSASERVFGQEIMKRIAGRVPEDPLVQFRKINAFQVVLVGIPEDLFDFRKLSEVLPSDQIGFPVTNIINGIGLFTSQTQAAYTLKLDAATRDSIMSGQYTRRFNFRFY